MTCHFKDFILATSYFPNVGIEDAARLEYRIKEWDPAFQHFLKEELEVGCGKPVILCGDLNVVHQEIDKYETGRPVSSTRRNISESFDPLLSSKGFIDTFRHQNPGKVEYSYYSSKG